MKALDSQQMRIIRENVCDLRDLGAHAYKMGVLLIANPYVQESTPHAVQWERGWLDAWRADV